MHRHAVGLQIAFPLRLLDGEGCIHTKCLLRKGSRREREREMREQWERNARLRLPACDDDSCKALQLCSTQLEDGGNKWGVGIPIFHFAGPD